MSAAEIREVEIQYLDFAPGDLKSLRLEAGERVLSVESGTRFDPKFRVWIEVPRKLAEERERTFAANR